MISTALAMASGAPVAPPLSLLGFDCQTVQVIGAGEVALDGLYTLSTPLNGRPRWAKGSDATIQYSAESEANGWFGAGTGAVYAIVDHTHRYLVKDTQHSGLSSAPLAGWYPRSKKTKEPAPKLTCAVIAPSCARARAVGIGLPFASGALFSRGGVGGSTPATFAFAIDGRGQATVSFAEGSWSLTAPEASSGRPQVLFTAGPDGLPASSAAPPLLGWVAHSSKHKTKATARGPPSLALECACGGAHFEAAEASGVLPRALGCAARCTREPSSIECATCMCTACSVCPPPPPLPPASSPPPSPPSPPPPPPRPTSQLMMSTGFEDGNVGGIEVSDSGGGGGGSMAWELPSRMAKRQGAHGLRVEVTHRGSHDACMHSHMCMHWMR